MFGNCNFSQIFRKLLALFILLLLISFHFACNAQINEAFKNVPNPNRRNSSASIFADPQKSALTMLLSSSISNSVPSSSPTTINSLITNENGSLITGDNLKGHHNNQWPNAINTTSSIPNSSFPMAPSVPETMASPHVSQLNRSDSILTRYFKPASNNSLDRHNARQNLQEQRLTNAFHQNHMETTTHVNNASQFSLANNPTNLTTTSFGFTNQDHPWEKTAATTNQPIKPFSNIPNEQKQQNLLQYPKQPEVGPNITNGETQGNLAMAIGQPMDMNLINATTMGQQSPIITVAEGTSTKMKEERNENGQSNNHRMPTANGTNHQHQNNSVNEQAFIGHHLLNNNGTSRNNQDINKNNGISNNGTNSTTNHINNNIINNNGHNARNNANTSSSSNAILNSNPNTTSISTNGFAMTLEPIGGEFGKLAERSNNFTGSSEEFPEPRQFKSPQSGRKNQTHEQNIPKENGTAGRNIQGAFPNQTTTPTPKYPLAEDEGISQNQLLKVVNGNGLNEHLENNGNRTSNANASNSMTSPSNGNGNVTTITLTNLETTGENGTAIGKSLKTKTITFGKEEAIQNGTKMQQILTAENIQEEIMPNGTMKNGTSIKGINLPNQQGTNRTSLQTIGLGETNGTNQTRLEITNEIGNGTMQRNLKENNHQIGMNGIGINGNEIRNGTTMGMREMTNNQQMSNGTSLSGQDQSDGRLAGNEGPLNGTNTIGLNTTNAEIPQNQMGVGHGRSSGRGGGKGEKPFIGEKVANGGNETNKMINGSQPTNVSIPRDGQLATYQFENGTIDSFDEGGGKQIPKGQSASSSLGGQSSFGNTTNGTKGIGQNQREPPAGNIGPFNGTESTSQNGADEKGKSNGKEGVGKIPSIDGKIANGRNETNQLMNGSQPSDATISRNGHLALATQLIGNGTNGTFAAEGRGKQAQEATTAGQSATPPSHGPSLFGSFENATNPFSSGIGQTASSSASIGTSTTPSTTVPPTTTTTQDPVVRKELERAGAPDILKLLVPPKPETLPEPAKQIIESKCADGKCLEQKAEYKEQRAVVVKQEQTTEQKLNPGKPVQQVQREVEQRVSKTFQLKKALLKDAGLEGKVEPANNGVFQADLLLTEEQAAALIAELERHRAQKAMASGRAKRAGNAIFMENSPTQRWPLGQPISYMFDQSLVDKDRLAIRMALEEIQAKTCLKFTEARSKPNNSHLYYTKIANPTFCGLSYVGRIEPANPIYLSFMCGNEPGIAMHETLHALGFQHEQLRFDRDQFITIQWENVNPQQLDFFTLSDVTKFSSYGLRYDYGSIMHYTSTIASQNPSKKTMTSKLAPFINDPLMGQRKGLSQTDVDALNKIYCSPPGCEDKLVYCGIWATLNLCNAQMWRRGVTHQWILNNCQKSCNKCGEKLEPLPSYKPF